MFPMRRSGLGVWVGGGAVQFFGEDGDAEVAGLDALDHGELENLQDLVGGDAGAKCVLEVAPPVAFDATAAMTRPGPLGRATQSQMTGRFSSPRNAQPPILTSSEVSSRRFLRRANRDGSATSATIAREANAMLFSVSRLIERRLESASSSACRRRASSD